MCVVEEILRMTLGVLDVELEMMKLHNEFPSVFPSGSRYGEKLRALDSLVASGKTYRGRESVVKEAESLHLKNPLHCAWMLVDPAPPWLDSYLLQVLDSKLLGHSPAAVSKGGSKASASSSQAYSAQSEAAPVKAQTPALVEATSWKAGKAALKRSADYVVDLTGSDDGANGVKVVRKKARGAGGGARTDADPTEHNDECIVCLMGEKRFACVPCGHVCMCAGCADTVQQRTRRCPLCRAATTQIIQLFF